MANPVGSFVALDPEARTASTFSRDLKGQWSSGVVIINCSAKTGTPSVTFDVEGKDPASGDYYPILTSVAITGTGMTVLRIHPAMVAATNVIAAEVLPHTFRVRATHADGDSITYSVGVMVA